MSKAKRWKKSIAKARWKTHKKSLITKGWVEVSENTLVPPGNEVLFPPYIPTHLGGKVEKERNKFIYKNVPGLPRRSEVNKLRKQAKRLNLTLRQFISGQW